MAKHIVVGRDADADTEAEAKAMAEEQFGVDNVVRGYKIDHDWGCPVPSDSIIGVATCDCPRQVVFSNARKLVVEK